MKLTINTSAVARKAFANPKTTASGLLYAASKFGAPIAKAWFPSKSQAIDTTAQCLEGASVFLLAYFAGDASTISPANRPGAPDPAPPAVNKPGP